MVSTLLQCNVLLVMQIKLNVASRGKPRSQKFHLGKILLNKYLLLTEFEVRTVSYGPSFFLLIYGPSAKRAGHKATGKNEDP